VDIRIGELARRTGVGVSTLRAWESRFRFLEPTRSPAGHRLYAIGDVERVDAVVRLVGEGLTLPAAIARVAMGGPGALPEGEAEALLFGQILQAANQGVWVARDGRTRYANRRMAEIMGYALDDLVAIPVLEFFAPEELDLVKERTAQVRAGHRVHFTQQLRRADGSRFLAEVDTTPLLNQAGRYEGAVSMVEDVTARQEADTVCRLQTTLLDNVEEAVAAATPDGKLVYINARAERLLGWRPSDVIGRDGEDLFARPEARNESRRIRALLLKGDRYTGRLKMRRHDGTEFVARLMATPATDERGALVGLVGLVRDQTERDQAERDLRARQLEAETLAVLGSQALRQPADRRPGEALILTEALEATRRVLRSDHSFVLDVIAGSRSFAGYVALARKAVVVGNMKLDRRFDPLPGSSTASAVGAPIFGPDGIRGVLTAGSNTPDNFQASAAHFIQGMANVIGTSRLA
jgi:PAS domain S-box-containing protein